VPTFGFSIPLINEGHDRRCMTWRCRPDAFHDRLLNPRRNPMSTVTPSKNQEIATDRLLIAGTQKHLKGASVFVNGTTYTGPEIEQRIQARLDAVTATMAARAAWLAAVKAEEQALSESQAFYNSYKRGLYNMFAAVDDLADFGLAPHKKSVMTPDEKVAAAAKAKATRAARHTMGKRQRLAITGAHPVASSSPTTPAVAPSASSPPREAVAPSPSMGATVPASAPGVAGGALTSNGTGSARSPDS
jgi:hypothetical protein